MSTRNYNKFRGEAEAFSPLASPIEEAANFEYEQNNSQGRGTHRAAN